MLCGRKQNKQNTNQPTNTYVDPSFHELFLAMAVGFSMSTARLQMLTLSNIHTGADCHCEMLAGWKGSNYSA